MKTDWSMFEVNSKHNFRTTTIFENKYCGKLI